MKIQDIASLVQIRNYAFSVREDRNVFRGDDYHKVTKQISRIDSFLSKVLTEEDLVKMVLQPVEKEPQDINDEPKKKSPVKKAKKITMELPSFRENVSDSQMPLNFESEKSEKDLSDDDDAALLAKRIAEEKDKLAKKKAG